MFPPKTEPIHKVGISQAEIDERAKTIHEWARGRSKEKRIEALEEANHQCQEYGTKEELQAHHRGGLKGYRGTKNLATAGRAKEIVILCKDCHLKVGHQGSFSPRNQGKNAA
jgi:hypothetical protein